MKRKFAGLCCIKDGDFLNRNGMSIEIRKGTNSFGYNEKMLRSFNKEEKHYIGELLLNAYIFHNQLNGVLK